MRIKIDIIPIHMVDDACRTQLLTVVPELNDPTLKLNDQNILALHLNGYNDGSIIVDNQLPYCLKISKGEYSVYFELL